MQGTGCREQDAGSTKRGSEVGWALAHHQNRCRWVVVRNGSRDGCPTNAPGRSCGARVPRAWHRHGAFGNGLPRSAMAAGTAAPQTLRDGLVGHASRVPCAAEVPCNVQTFQRSVHPELHEIETWTDVITASASAAFTRVRTRFSDGDSASHRSPRRRSGATTVGMVTFGSFRLVSSRWAADVKGKPGSEPGA